MARSAKTIALRCVALRCVLTGSAFLGSLAHFGQADAWAAEEEPLRVSLVGCSPGLTGQLLANNQGRGFGNSPADRQSLVTLAYHHDAGDVENAISLIDRIEICWLSVVDVGGQSEVRGHCPGTGQWLVFDRASSSGTEPSPDRVANCAVTDQVPQFESLTQNLSSPMVHCSEAIALSTRIELPVIEGELDWGDPSLGSADRALFIRVVPAGEPVIPAEELSYEELLMIANQHGICPNFSIRASAPTGEQPYPHILSANPAFAPFGDDLNLCLGHRIVNPTFNLRSQCLFTDEQAEYARLVMRSISQNHDDRLMRQLGEEERRYSWKNGVSDTGATQPGNVALLGLPTSFEANMAIFITRDHYSAIDTATDTPDTFLDPVSPGGFRRPSHASPAIAVDQPTHELFHVFQDAWSRESPSARALIFPGTYFSEALAFSVQATSCLLDFPNEPDPDRCVSFAKILNRAQSASPAKNAYYDGSWTLLASPESDTLLVPYKSGFFWNYVYSQFAYTPPTLAHPSGVASLIPREARADELTPKERLSSDQGYDFIGLLFDQIVGAEDGQAVFDVADDALVAYLGRNFRDVLFDFHTAMYLKDYTDTDERWRFDWAHKDGFTADTLMSSLKPLPIPPDLYGRTDDGFARTRRTLDSRVACTAGACTPTLATLPAGQSRWGNNVQLGPYGATALAVSPDAGWVGQNMKVALSGVSGQSLRFRVFRVDRDGEVDLVPTPLCGVSPLHECVPITREGSPGLWLSLDVPITDRTDEVLIVASTAGTPARFDWSFGPVQPRLSIVEPSTSRPAFIGNGSERRTFVVRLMKRDETGAPIDIPQESLTLSVPDCAKAAQGADACDVPSTSIQVVGASSGLAILAVTLPADFYPELAQGEVQLFDLKAVATNVAEPAVATDALKASDGTDTQATVFVLDRSGSMPGEKLTALKAATKGLLQSLVPADAATAATDQVGIVAFSFDAVTLTSPALISVDQSSIDGLLSTIDAMETVDKTSIGDGVFEAQSILAAAFDSLQPAERPTRQVMVVLSDGIENWDAFSELYYRTDLGPAPTNDEEGEPWISGPLAWPARKRANPPLPLPDDIQTIAIGKDADLARLSGLSRLTNSATLFLPVPGEPAAEALVIGNAEVSRTELSIGDDPFELTRRIANSLSAGYANGSTYSRIWAQDHPVAEFETSTGVALSGFGPNAQELRVMVVGSLAASRGFVLVGPAGAVAPTAQSGDSVAFRIANPAGDWRLQKEATPGVPETGDEVFFVEATVRSPVELLAFADVADLARSDGGEPIGSATVGAPVLIRAVPRAGQPVLGCSATATVTGPSGSEYWLELYDDGQHQDQGAGDGVYGSTFSMTGLPGVYDMVLAVECVSPQENIPFRRERRTGVILAGLAAASDTDGDGMPNTWETSHGLSPTDPSDADDDPDGDELTNLEEFGVGTNPQESDSDDGGESDGSEVQSGLNPMSLGDDRVSRPIVLPEPGNHLVLLRPGMGIGSGTLVVERASSLEGPWNRLSSVFEPGNAWAVDSTVTNGTSYCYRVRAELDATSGWSVPRCTAPNDDPYPPTITLIGPEPCVGGRDVELRFDIGDSVLPTDHPSSIPIDLGVSATGARELRYWFTAGDPPMAATWEPLSNPLVVTLPESIATLSVQVRDGAGNVSPPLRMVMPPYGGCVAADAGPDQVLECEADSSATTMLDASESRDAYGGDLGFLWSAEDVEIDEPTIANPLVTFPLGTTTATVEVRNSNGNVASDTVDITVVDTTQPILRVPADVLSVGCGAVSLGAAQATDSCGGTVTITNNAPASFPLGVTIVTWRATDASGNTVTGSQRVTKLPVDDPSCCPAGSKVIRGTSNNDVLNGTSGVDCIFGFGGQDQINGLGGNDILSGGEGDDILTGGGGDDVMHGGNGQDQLSGSVGIDVMDGGGGDDRCWGGDQDDIIRGGQGQDGLYGENGNDQLFGDDGDDRLEGGPGNDLLNGGGLHDTCIGGTGTNTFTMCQTQQ